MKICIIFLLILLPALCIGQTKKFEIFGTISGEYNTKVYLFFEDNYKKRDSISSKIENGKFYFQATASIPILARLHLEQGSFIQDLYIDSKKVIIYSTNKYFIRKNHLGNADTLNQFEILRVEGSTMEDIKRGFESSVAALNSSDKTEVEKNVQYYEKLLGFVKKYPANKVSAYLVGKASSLTYSQVNELNSLLNPALQETYEGKTVRALINNLDKSRNKTVGKVFQDFPLIDTSDKQVYINDYKEQLTLIEFWASWCGPCRASFPGLKVLYNKYKGSGFEIVGVSFDKVKEKWTKAIISDKLEWPQLLDLKDELGNFYAIEAIPANILLDETNRIIGVNLSNEEVEVILKNKMK